MEKIAIEKEIECVKCGNFIRTVKYETDALYSNPGIQGKTVKRNDYDCCKKEECESAFKKKIDEARKNGKYKVILPVKPVVVKPEKKKKNKKKKKRR